MGSEDWNDPYGIVPRSFRNNFPNADSVREALNHAGRLPSSTPPGERHTCPDCGSVGISPIGTGQGDGSRWDWKCNECENRFNEPNKPDMDRYDNTAHLRFNFLDDNDLKDPDRRTELDPPFADADRETAVALAVLLRRPWREEDARRSYTQVARYLAYKDSWVGHRVREWRDGAHRDLVPDPTADPDPDPAPSGDPPLNPAVAVARIGGDYEELLAQRTQSNDAGASVETAADGGTRRSRWAAYGSD